MKTTLKLIIPLAAAMMSAACNKYADNGIDGSENPFWATPMRSPLDNLMISVGLNYRFNKQGFEAWKPRPKKEKNREVFKFGL